MRDGSGAPMGVKTLADAWVFWLQQAMTPPFIHTERLLLRGWTPDDLAPFAAMCADPEVMRYIRDGKTRSRAQSARSIASFQQGWRARGYGLFAVEAKDTGDLIGFAGLSSPDFLPEVYPSVEIGWRFSKPNWGRGYASEAAAAALAFGVKDRGITDIVSICQIENGASARIMQKLGMVFDRRTTDPSCGHAVDVYRLPQG